MTGLEKIIEQIQQEARITSERELDKTKKEVEQILADGLQKREAYKTAFLEQTESQVELLLRRGEASAALQKRKILLKEKQNLITQMMGLAKEKILSLPVEDYFQFLLQMLNHYGKDGQCQLILSKRDLERVPDSFLEELKKRDIVLSKECGKIFGGFLLVYENVEENCSIEALFSSHKEVLQDQIGALIFTNSNAETER